MPFAGWTAGSETSGAQAVPARRCVDRNHSAALSRSHSRWSSCTRSRQRRQVDAVTYLARCAGRQEVALELQGRRNAAHRVAGGGVDQDAFKEIPGTVDQVPVRIQLEVAAPDVTVDAAEQRLVAAEPCRRLYDEIAIAMIAMSVVDLVLWIVPWTLFVAREFAMTPPTIWRVVAPSHPGSMFAKLVSIPLSICYKKSRPSWAAASDSFCRQAAGFAD